MPGSPTWLEHGLGLALGLVPALAFLHPTGYSVGPVLLLLGSIASGMSQVNFTHNSGAMMYGTGQ